MKQRGTSSRWRVWSLLVAGLCLISAASLAHGGHRARVFEGSIGLPDGNSFRFTLENRKTLSITNEDSGQTLIFSPSLDEDQNHWLWIVFETRTVPGRPILRAGPGRFRRRWYLERENGRIWTVLPKARVHGPQPLSRLIGEGSALNKFLF